MWTVYKDPFALNYYKYVIVENCIYLVDILINSGLSADR